MKQCNKTILVTGGAGFIGSHYLNTYVRKYPSYRFINVDMITYAGNLDNILVSGEANYVFERNDIRNKEGMTGIFETHRPTHIIHFAAESHVDNSIANPLIFTETNVYGTHILLELALQYGIKRFHFISTDEVYGSLQHKERPSREEDVLAPNSPYSASKAAAEMLVRAYHKTFGLDMVVTRASNNFGPNQHREKLIPLFILNLLRGEKVPLYGMGKNIRDWLYVGDHVRAVDIVFHRGKNGETYNIGGNCQLENKKITEKLLIFTGRDPSSIEHVTDRPGHDFRYALDVSKIKKELGWRPLKKFDDGLRETVEFYRKQANS